MSLREMLHKIYKENRFMIFALLGMALSMSILILNAITGQADELTSEAMGTFGGSLAYSIQYIATQNGLAIEPSITFMIIVLLSILVDNGIWPSGLMVPSFGLLEYN